MSGARKGFGFRHLKQTDLWRHYSSLPRISYFLMSPLSLPLHFLSTPPTRPPQTKRDLGNKPKLNGAIAKTPKTLERPPPPKKGGHRKSRKTLETNQKKQSLGRIVWFGCDLDHLGSCPPRDQGLGTLFLSPVTGPCSPASTTRPPRHEAASGPSDRGRLVSLHSESS